MQVLTRTGLAGPMLGSSYRRARSSLDYGAAPVCWADGYIRRIRLEEVLVVQLTKFSALPRFGHAWIGRSLTPPPSPTPFTSVLLARRSARGNHRPLLATDRVEVLELPFRVLSGTTVPFCFQSHTLDQGPS